MLENGIRKMKPNADPLPVILVGGGAILAPDTLAHASAIHRPKNSGVANAIGAAIALIGGEAERFVNYNERSRDVCIADTHMAAHDAAIAAGAATETIRVTEIEETPIPYMDQGAMRIRIKVVGDVEALVSGKEPAL
jgi:hypothetical protein